MATSYHPRKRPSTGTRAIVLVIALMSLPVLGSAALLDATAGTPTAPQDICTLLPYWPGCPQQR